MERDGNEMEKEACNEVIGITEASGMQLSLIHICGCGICFCILVSMCCRNISAIMLDNGDPIVKTKLL